MYSFISRGKGPLKHTTDVIYAAKMISESGSRMDVLARQIANQVSSLQMDVLNVQAIILCYLTLIRTKLNFYSVGLFFA